MQQEEDIHVILVNEKDEPIGTAPKLDAHKLGKLHRAFSLFLFNSEGQMLLQKRAMSKYHSPGLWTNACCSHPFPDEATKAAVKRRLREEMGMSASNPIKQFEFIYNASLDQGMTEHEFDHVYTAVSDEQPKPNPDEVCDTTYVDMKDLKSDMDANPEKYTVWFRIAFPKLEAALNNRKTL